MSQVELRHLRFISVIVDEGSISRAAAMLGLSQPALTAQVQRIERLFGVRLFDRGQSGTVPTEFGRSVAARARTLLNEVESLVGLDRAENTPELSALHIATHSTPYTGQLVHELRTAMGWPEIRVETHSSGRLVVDALSAGKIHLALAEQTAHAPLPRHPDVEVHRLVTQPAFLALPDDHPLTKQAAIPLSASADCEWVTPPVDDELASATFHAAWAEAGITPKVRHYSHDNATARSMIKAGAVSLVMPSFSGDGITLRPLAGDPITIDLMLALQANGPLASRVGDVIRCVAKAYRLPGIALGRLSSD